MLGDTFVGNRCPSTGEPDVGEHYELLLELRPFDRYSSIRSVQFLRRQDIIVPVETISLDFYWTFSTKALYDFNFAQKRQDILILS